MSACDPRGPGLLFSGAELGKLNTFDPTLVSGAGPPMLACLPWAPPTRRGWLGSAPAAKSSVPACLAGRRSWRGQLLCVQCSWACLELQQRTRLELAPRPTDPCGPLLCLLGRAAGAGGGDVRAVHPDALPRAGGGQAAEPAGHLQAGRHACGPGQGCQVQPGGQRPLLPVSGGRVGWGGNGEETRQARGRRRGAARRTGAAAMRRAWLDLAPQRCAGARCAVLDTSLPLLLMPSLLGLTAACCPRPPCPQVCCPACRRHLWLWPAEGEGGPSALSQPLRLPRPRPEPLRVPPGLQPAAQPVASGGAAGL